MEPLRQQQWTWDDYRTWNDDQRWELIASEPYCMSPSPTSRHQAIALDLGAWMAQHFKDKTCRPLISPMDVKLSDHDVVQPDLLVVCNPSQIRPTHIEGAPALVVEILSPSSTRHDRVRKLGLYARSGVSEYWLIQPYPALVEVLQLDGEGYRIAGVYTEADRLQSPSFPELTLDLAEIFTLPVLPEELIDEVRESAPPAYASGTVEV
nr:uncharacterized protein slr1290-like [Nerophis lumbriciformis]